MYNLYKFGDNIKVIYGKYKGIISNVKNINKNKVLIKKINKIVRCIKNKKFFNKEKPINTSNIIHYMEEYNDISRVGCKYINKNKIRFYIKSGKLLDNIK